MAAGGRHRALRLGRGVAPAGAAAGRTAGHAGSRVCIWPARRRCPTCWPRSTRSSPTCLVVDSIQTVFEPELGSAPGSVAQVRECAARLVRQAKSRGIWPPCWWATSPRTAPWPVPGCSSTWSTPCCRSRATATTHCGCCGPSSTASAPPTSWACSRWATVAWSPVPDASGLFLADRRPGVSGSVVVPTIEGHRPAAGRGAGAWWSSRRCRRPAARPRASTAAGCRCCWPCWPERAGTDLGGLDVYALAVGGVKVAEPGADLGVALALASSAARPGPARRDLVVRRDRPGRRAAPGGPVPPAAGRGPAARATTGPSSPGCRPPVPEGMQALRAATLAEALDLAGDRPGWLRPRRVDWRSDPPAKRRAARGPGGGRARQAPAGGPRPHPAVEDGRPDRGRRRSRGAEHLLRRLPARRRLQPPAPVGAGQDGRRHHPGARRQPHRPGQRAPGAQPQRAHLRDRHPAPHRRAGGPLHRRAGDLGVRGAWASSPATSGDQKHPLETIPRLLNRANQALQTLERYSDRLDEVSASLSALEIEDLVTLRDVVVLLQRTEMVLRIAEEIDEYIVELGVDGRLVRLQLEEVLGGDRGRAPPGGARLLPRQCDSWTLGRRHVGAWPTLDTEELLDLRAVADVLHLPEGADDLDLRPAAPRATACCRGSPASPSRSSTASSSASAPCRRSCGPPSTTSTTSRAWARAGPGPSRRACRRLAETSLLDRFG